MLNMDQVQQINELFDRERVEVINQEDALAQEDDLVEE